MTIDGHDVGTFTYEDCQSGCDDLPVHAGSLVEVSDQAHGGVTTKQHTVTDLETTSVNTATNVVTGIGTGPVSVWVSGGGPSLQVTGGGTWQADFSGQSDLAGGAQGDSSQTDSDGDSTHAAWETPRLSIQRQQDMIVGQGGWVEGDTVTVVIDDPTDQHDRTLSAIAGTRDIGMDSWDVSDGQPLEPGYTITSTQCPDGYWVCWAPQNMVMVQAFDLSDPAFQAVFGSDPAPDQYEAIWGSGNVPVVNGLAAAVEFTGMYHLSPDGTVEMRYPNASDHLVLIRYFDAELGEQVVVAKTSTAAALVDRGDGILVGDPLTFRLWDAVNEPDEQAEAALILLEDLGSTDPNIADAIDALDDALDPTVWADDGTLEDGASGVFQDLAKAANELGKIGDSSTAVSEVVAAVLDTARGLAQAEVDLALEFVPQSPHTAKALAEIQRAAEDEGLGKYDDAIKHYKQAWVFAGKALA